MVDAIADRDDRQVDDLLQSAVNERAGGCAGRVYSVFVMEGERERVVVGKHRHAWMVVKKLDDSASVGSIIGSVFGDYFIRRGIGKGEYVPVGSDGNVVLSFSLLNSDPSGWVYDWYVPIYSQFLSDSGFTRCFFFFFHVLILKNLRECCFLIQGFSNDWRGLVRTCYGGLGACCKHNHGESGVLVSFIHSNNQLFEKRQLGDDIKFEASKIYKKSSKLV